MAPIAVVGFIALAAGIAVILAVVLVGMLERAEANRALRTVSLDAPAITETRRRELAVPVTQRVIIPLLQRVTARVTRFAPSSVVQRLDQEVVYAGEAPALDGERLLALKTVAATVIPVLVLVAMFVLGAPVTVIPVGVAMGAALGYYFPEWIVRSRARRRQAEIQRVLPDALDLLSITVEAGLGFDAAVDRVARELRGPLGGELYRMVQEMRLGKSRGQALRDLGKRSNVEEVHTFVLAMVQAEAFGISIATVLNIQAQELRIRRRQRAEEMAQKLPVKILFPLLFGIFPALFVVLLGPAMLQIYDNILNQ